MHLQPDLDLRATYNRIAEDWHKDHQSDDWWKAGMADLLKRLRPGQTVLDAGCGTGVKSNMFHEAHLAVVGIDFSTKMIEIAKREYPGIDFRVMDMRFASQLERKFDLIFAQASLLHLEKDEVERVVASWAQLLNRGGYLYIAVKAHREGRPESEVRVERDYGYEYRRFFSYFSLDEVHRLFMKNDFRVFQTFAGSDWIQVTGRHR